MSTWSLAKAHADLKAWWPAAGFDAAGHPYASRLRQAYGAASRHNSTMKPITVAFDPRSFVIGFSNYTLDPYHWSWTVYLGPLFIQIHILKPRRMRRRGG